MSFILLGCVGYELSDALRREMFCLNLTSEHQTEAGGSIGESPKTTESYTETQTAGGQAGTCTHTHVYTMNRCELVVGHKRHVKHNEWMHGDLCSCL